MKTLILLTLASFTIFDIGFPPENDTLMAVSKLPRGYIFCKYGSIKLDDTSCIQKNQLLDTKVSTMIAYANPK